jgi:hypothetical protein
MDREDSRGRRDIEPRTGSGRSGWCSGISARGYDRRWWITRVDVIGIPYICTFFEGCDGTIDKVVQSFVGRVILVRASILRLV